MQSLAKDVAQTGTLLHLRYQIDILQARSGAVGCTHERELWDRDCQGLHHSAGVAIKRLGLTDLVSGFPTLPFHTVVLVCLTL